MSSCRSCAWLSVAIWAASFATTFMGIEAMYGPKVRRHLLRRKLPNTIYSWRVPGPTTEDEELIWIYLADTFRQEGFELWPHDQYCITTSPHDTYPTSNGFFYSLRQRDIGFNSGSTRSFKRFVYSNPLCRAARTREGQDGILRLLALGQEGREHLDIVRKLGTAPTSYFSNNHCLPLLREFALDDIIFGFFPRCGFRCDEVYRSWTKNSVGDILEIILQSLEALEFIHSLKIAHRDAFKDNFLVQWHPESMLSEKPSPSRPRVYLIDFECAVGFPSRCLESECTCTGIPLFGSLSDVETYSRPCPPEVTSGRPYCPFKLDVWQLGMSYSDFRSNVPDIDDLLSGMCITEPRRRMSSNAVFAKLSALLHEIPPAALHLQPTIVDRVYI